MSQPPVPANIHFVQICADPGCARGSEGQAGQAQAPSTMLTLTFMSHPVADAGAAALAHGRQGEAGRPSSRARRSCRSPGRDIKHSISDISLALPQEPILALLHKHMDAKGKQAKLKSPAELQELLDVTRGLLKDLDAEQESTPETDELREKFRIVKVWRNGRESFKVAWNVLPKDLDVEHGRWLRLTGCARAA